MNERLAERKEIVGTLLLRDTLSVTLSTDAFPPPNCMKREHVPEYPPGKLVHAYTRPK